MANKTGKNYCFVSLLSANPSLIEEWDYVKNDQIGIFPDLVSQYSNKKVWWKCNKCGHGWQATINNRSNGKSCPECAQERRNAKKRSAEKGVNDLATLFPEIAKTWNYERNTMYSPSDLKPYSEVKVWWKCERGHEWESTVHNRVANKGCPICSRGLKTSLPEQAFFFYLSKLFRADNRVIVAGWEIDIFLPDYNIGIEYDGWRYHSSQSAKDREKKKNTALEQAGIYLIRVKENKEEDIVNDNTVYYIIESNYGHLCFAIESVLSIISKTIEKPLYIDINFKRDRFDILNTFYAYEKAHSLAKEHPEIAKEWNYAKNNGLGPDMVSSGSGEKVWWRCPQGHEYMATVYNRVGLGSGCPVCSGKKILIGFNDLASVNPLLASEWNYDKNKPRLPSDFTPNSGKKVWWICNNHHEYQATIASRNSGTGCPYCSRKWLLSGYNDLMSLFPELVDEWNWKKNGTLLPSKITAYNKRKVWWICSQGHEYMASIGARTGKNQGCPYCSGQKALEGFNDLCTKIPDILKEWDYQNNNLLPTEVTIGSGKKVWWICPSCGEKYQMAVYAKVQGRGCPECAKKQRWITRREKNHSETVQGAKDLKC